MIITVGGNVSSGKSVVARYLAEKLGIRYISAGKVMRDMASERGMSLSEFQRYAEENPEVDKEIDERQKQRAKGDCVVDGRLSGHFLDCDYRIWLTAPIKERTRRLMGREEKYSDMDEALDSIRNREESERKRYMEFYDIDLEDLSIYDLVLNTGKYGIEEMKDTVLKAVESASLDS